MRHNAAERAMRRFYQRQWRDMLIRSMDEINAAAAREYSDSREAFKAVAKAAQSAAKNFVSDVIGAYVKERVIRPALHDIGLGR